MNKMIHPPSVSTGFLHICKTDFSVKFRFLRRNFVLESLGSRGGGGGGYLLAPHAKCVHTVRSYFFFIYVIADEQQQLIHSWRVASLFYRKISRNSLQCQQLVEEHEEAIENWYFHKQNSDPDMFAWLCYDKLNLCCPEGRYGKDCKPCPGVEKGLPACFGRGTCHVSDVWSSHRKALCAFRRVRDGLGRVEGVGAREEESEAGLSGHCVRA